MRTLSDRLLSSRVLTGEPPMPPGAWLHLRASDVTTSPVSAWLDRSGRGRDALQSTPGSQPTLSSTAANGKAAVTFDGSDDFLTVTNFPNQAQPITVMGVVRSHLTSSGLFTFVGVGGSAVSFGTTSGTFSTFAAETLSSSVSIDTDWHIYLATISGGSSRIRIDSTTNTGNAGTRGFTTSLRIGAFASGQQHWDGDVAEIVIYPRNLTQDDEDYLFGLYSKMYGIPI